jgi:tetratricopeptide (TPR) repeat protein
MKRGFWTGFLAFIIAKIFHLIITGAIGLILVTIIGDKPISWDIINIIDSPLFGIVFLIFATAFIYKKLTKNKKSTKESQIGNKSSLSSEDLEQITEDVNVIDTVVERTTSKIDATPNNNDNSAFKANIETSWGGEELSIVTFFKKYFDDKEQLELKKPDILKNNTFYAKEESNEKGHIFIFFEDAEDAIEKFKEIIKPHSSSDVFFNLTSEQISSWISQYKSEIECLCILGCKIQLSKGVNMYRIDISLKGSFTWAQINSVNANKALIFTYPFSSPFEYDLPDIELNFDLSESVMLASTYFNILDDNNLTIPIYDSYYSEDEIKVFTHTKGFKSFWNFSRNYVLVDKIDPLQSNVFKNIFQKFNTEFSLFDKLNLCFQLIQKPKKTFSIDNDDLGIIIEQFKYTEKTTELIRLNKYLGIQDGEFILFSMMKNRMNEVQPYLDNFKDLEDLFVSMKEESNELAVELRRKLVGDLPLNLIDRPTDIKVDQNDDNDPFSNYSKKTLELYKTATDYLISGNHQMADIELKKVIEDDKHMLPAYYNLSAIKINFQQDYFGAINLLDLIINMQGYNKNPDIVYADLHYNRGLAKSYLELEEDAIKDFNEALKINPEHVPSFGSRGCSFMNANMNKEALADFNKAILLGDNSFENIANRAKCKQSLGDFKGALEDFNAAYDIDAHNEDINLQRDLLLTLSESGLMDELNNVMGDNEEKITLEEEKLSYIFEILFRISFADNKLDESETELISNSIHKLRDIYDFQGEIKRPTSLPFLDKLGDIYSDEEKHSIITLLISLIYADNTVTYSELSLAIAFVLCFHFQIDKAEELISVICENEKLDENTFYLYITQIFSEMKSEMPEFNDKDILLIENILKLNEDEVSSQFKQLSDEIKTNVFLATIFYDEKRELNRNEADEINDIAWHKMDSGDYESALIDAKKSIDILSMSSNNDTIALIYFHLKNYVDAKKFADISIELDTSRSDHYVTRAKILLKLNQVDLAKTDLIKAIQLNEENLEASTLLESVK